MRALAATLRGLAGPLGTVGKVDLENWESPRGREVKGEIQRGAGAAASASDELLHLATEIARAADRVEQAQFDWSARAEAALADAARGQTAQGAATGSRGAARP
jgi:hypothetical protein